MNIKDLATVQDIYRNMDTLDRSLVENVVNPMPTERLLDFTTETYQQYEPNRFSAFVADKLDKVARGETRRLIICAPPQHSKSELVSVRFPAFYLGRNPDAPIILSSYGATLAEDKGRQVRAVVESPEYTKIFPKVTTNKESRAVALWHVQGHLGKMLSVGVGGPITGHGAMLGIIDDAVSNWEDANSPTIRQKTWDWYKTTFRTRVWERGAIVVVMCMTGDTPVLLADGTEKPLSDIKVGDKVATYNNGALDISTVKTHKSNGPDKIFEIKTTDGRTVRANARHPFLVNEGGKLKWIRLRNLTTAHKIVTLKGKKVNGKENLALLKIVKKQSRQGGIVPNTTIKRNVSMDTVHLQQTPKLGVKDALKTDTELHSPNTKLCLQPKMESVPFVDNHREKMYAPIGAESSVLTTVTRQVKYAPYYATAATLPSDTLKQSKMDWLLSNTSNFTTVGIESITPDGTGEVFDVEIENTENFIANGLVSHNTRWHSLDLVGQILNSSGSEDWEVYRVPAISESQPVRDKANSLYNLPSGLPDFLSRKENEAAAPNRFSIQILEKIKRDVGSQGWNSLYQGAPFDVEGNRIRPEWLTISPTSAPINNTTFRVRAWDKAGSDKADSDYTAGVLMAFDSIDNRYYIEDVVRFQKSVGARDKIILETAQSDAAKYGNSVAIFHEQEPGSAGKDVATLINQMLRAYPVSSATATGSKEIRFEPFAKACERREVCIVQDNPEKRWNQIFIDELISFPSGSHDDLCDASAYSYSQLALRKPKIELISY